VRKLIFTVNGKRRTCMVRDHETLLEVLRNRLGLKGAKDGCSTGDCGACAVILDNQLVNSCLMLAIQARGSRILTIEGIGSRQRLHRLQRTFIQEGAVQCGYCTPAMILAAKNLLDRQIKPSEGSIRNEISGILCRCTGYKQIVRAIQAGSQRRTRR
jgi:carbon-monoxide dehydrogenase small subunit